MPGGRNGKDTALSNPEPTNSAQVYGGVEEPMESGRVSAGVWGKVRCTELGRLNPWAGEGSLGNGALGAVGVDRQAWGEI